ncbi:MAG: hypothetical protein ACK4NC_00975 [Candidatus Gracilibacteria bacterium]
MHILRNIFFLAALVIVTACTNNSLPASLSPDTSYAFGTPGRFIMGIDQNDASQASKLYVVQQDKEFIFLREDTSDSILCSNLSGSGSCISRNKKIFSQDETATLIRVAAQSVRRIALRERSLSEPTIELSSTNPKFTSADPDKMISSLKQYFPARVEVAADQCATLSKTDEKEFVCFWNDFMPFYQYVETSDIPVASMRALFSYKDISLTTQQMNTLLISMQSDMQNN